MSGHKSKRKGRAASKKTGGGWGVGYATGGTVAALWLAMQVYAPALRGPFLFDDIALPYGKAGFPAALHFWIGGVRPLLMFTYWLNYRFSQDPFGFHAINLALHLVNGCLVFLIVRKLSPGRLLPGFAAAVFVVHPIQTEAVSYIAGRSESLSALFFLAAFTIFLYRRSAAVSWKVAAGVLGLFGAAVASKEHTLVLPALLLLTDYYWNPGFSLGGMRRNWRLYAPIAACAAAGAAIVARVLGANVTAGFGLKGVTWYQYFFTECRAFFVYLRLLVFPAGQNLDWDFPVSRSVLDHGAICAFAAIMILAAAAIFLRRRWPLASFGFVVFLLLLAPTSSFVPIADPFAERRLYLPMLGFLLVTVAALERVRIRRRALAGGLCAVAGILAFMTYQRNQLWADDVAMWEDAARHSPGKQRVQFQLADTYMNHGRCAEAVARFAETARIKKPDSAILVDWALAYDCAERPEEALSKLREAAALQPGAQVYTLIGMVYAKRSRWPEALAALGRAETLDPNYDMIYDNRGGIRSHTNDLSGAMAEYQHALALNPANEHARQMAAIVERQLSFQR